ncbi:ABC transporter, ATP-binding/permease protein [Chondrocystis sp. NIES-4102]|nr:ABC transporter, ATP-binding/permease protein [Chondrocystis sp. NIES-4102]
MQGVLPGATVYLTKIVVNSLVAVIGTGINPANIRSLAIPVGLMAGVLGLTELLKGASDYIRSAQSEYLQDHISGLIHSQSVDIDFACYESSEYSDRLSRARDNASNTSLNLLDSSGGLVQNTITLLTMGAILLPYGWWLPIVLVVSAIPAFYIFLRINKIQYDWSQKTTTDRRRLNYYEIILTGSAFAAEVRLFNLGSYFQNKYQKLRRRLRNENLKLIRDRGVARLGASAIALLISGGALVWMGSKALLGTITLGDLALFYQAFNRGQGIIKAILGNFNVIYKNSLFISNLFEFLALKPEIVDSPQLVEIPKRLRKSIRFENVSFSYPGSDRLVLENFNLTIPAGKIIAIVGDNGAGKSTLIKLLCRFYDPQAGGITVDGTDIRYFSVDKLRKSISVLFQFPIPYYLTAEENIILGDLTTDFERSQIEAAAKGSGIHQKLINLPQGYDTVLGKWFPNGTDLSGGEWQRLALARAFLKQAQIIILDEPTSAMDPWAEFDWLERFRNLAREQTSIVITHRFTLAMRADLIYVMRGGKIVETGNHEKLISLGGLYADSWNKQMKQPESY